MDNRENLIGVLTTLFRWKKQIILISAITFIGSALLSWFFLENYYQSTTIFYAASPDLAKPEPVGALLKEKDYYGTEEDNDRILTIAQSSEVIDFLINKFNLYEHYDIDTSLEKAKHRVRKEFTGLYDVKKTKFEAIEMSMEDVEKKMAADIVNAARDKVDEIGQRLIKESQKKQLGTYEKNIKRKQKNIIMIGDSLASMRRTYGIYNIKSQSELIASLVAKAESKLARNKAKLNKLRSTNVNSDTLLIIEANVIGLEQELFSLTSSESKSNFNLKRFNEGMAMVEVLFQQHQEANDQLSLDIERYNQLKIAYEAAVPSIHLVEKGSIPVIKSRPKRSIIVLAATFLAFVFSVIGVLIFDAYKDINWGAVVRGE